MYDTPAEWIVSSQRLGCNIENTGASLLYEMKIDRKGYVRTTRGVPEDPRKRLIAAVPREIAQQEEGIRRIMAKVQELIR